MKMVDDETFYELASLSALGLLEEAEQVQLEQYLQAHPESESELADLTQTSALLAYSLSMPPLGDLDHIKQQLLAGIRSELPATTMEAIRAKDRQWIPLPMPGIRIVILKEDLVRRERTLLLQADPGAIYPLHRNGGPEEVYILEGDLQVDGHAYGVGDYMWAPTSITHELTSITGCLCLVRCSIDDEMLVGV